MKNFIHSLIDPLRDKYTPTTSTSTFRATGQLTPAEFLAAGDFLVYKFPSWAWADASTPAKRVSYLPDGKQYLVTRGVPCHRRLDSNFAGEEGESVVQDGFAKGEGEEGEEGWLRTGGGGAKVADVRTVDDSGEVGEQAEEEEEIPDMEDEEDDEDAIIREPGDGTKTPLRTYSLFITYTPYYRTPRLYLSGYISTSEPLPPALMMEDIAGDYNDKTVTLEDFPFSDPTQSIKMASVHPCKHASVMKTLLDRADAALKIRREKLRHGAPASSKVSGLEGLEDAAAKLSVAERGHQGGVAAAGGNGGDEWEVLQHEGGEEESAIRVDQYLVVFLKFMASVTPGIEHDFTMGV